MQEIEEVEQKLREALRTATPTQRPQIEEAFAELDRIRARALVGETRAAAAMLAALIDTLSGVIATSLDDASTRRRGREPRNASTRTDVTVVPGNNRGSVASTGGADGQPSSSAGAATTPIGPEVRIVVSEQDLDALARVTNSEVAVFARYGEDQLRGGIAAVIDTIFNRVAHPSSEFPDSIQEVVDRPAQFSAINGPGSWTGLPVAEQTLFNLVKAHVVARASGTSSRIRGALHFLNPRKSSVEALRQWGNHVVSHAVAWYGDRDGDFVHFHGFAPGYVPPSAYCIEYNGVASSFDGEGRRLQTAPDTELRISQPTIDRAADGQLLPEDWTPDVKMVRIIVHWTAGDYRASEHDRFSYHILVESDGNLVRGTFSIADNLGNLVHNPRSYAAHTKGTNTGSIGVSMCCMLGAEEGPPFRSGSYPMTKTQWDKMIAVVAELCKKYAIAVSPQTVLGHGEVEMILGRPQDGKWDPMVLPWSVGLTKREVGELLRSQVAGLM